MAKEDLIETTGVIDEVLPNSTFRVKLDGMDHIAICYLGGKLKKNRIKIIRGDSVKIEMSPYSLERGRIVWRG